MDVCIRVEKGKTQFVGRFHNLRLLRLLFHGPLSTLTIDPSFIPTIQKSPLFHTPSDPRPLLPESVSQTRSRRSSGTFFSSSRSVGADLVNPGRIQLGSVLDCNLRSSSPPIKVFVSSIALSVLQSLELVVRCNFCSGTYRYYDLPFCSPGTLLSQVM